jgi:hypothetical protein
MPAKAGQLQYFSAKFENIALLSPIAILAHFLYTASSTYGISSSILSELKNRRKGKLYMKVQRGGDNLIFNF